MQRKQYCQLCPNPIVAILDEKIFKVKYDFLNFYGIRYYFFSVLKLEIEIPWSIFFDP